MNTLYTFTLTQQNATTLEIAVSLNPSHTIFEGHFPEQSILPGASMMVMVREVLEQVLDLKLVFTSSSVVKFLSFISPDENPDFVAYFSFIQEENNLVVNAEFKREEKSLFKYKSTYLIQA